MTPDEIAGGRERQQARYDAARTREADVATLPGVQVDPVYGPPPGSDDLDRSRDEARVQAAPRALVEAARGEGTTIAPMLRAEVTLGELYGVLRDLWGSCQEPPRL
jgi:methylmalonyl-CoA mutase N-terminal domain/subunit